MKRAKPLDVCDTLGARCLDRKTLESLRRGHMIALMLGSRMVGATTSAVQAARKEEIGWGVGGNGDGGQRIAAAPPPPPPGTAAEPYALGVDDLAEKLGGHRGLPRPRSS